MWEHRLVWPELPPWWEGAWNRGLEFVERRGRTAEQRPDRYFVLPERTDLGIKIRGGSGDAIELKVRYLQQSGWELWEKCVFFRWNDLEASRFAAMTGTRGASSDDAASARAGVEAVVGSLGLRYDAVEVRKTRIQLPAWGVIPGLGDRTVESLLELVKIDLSGEVGPIYSMCLESKSPMPGCVDARIASSASNVGYPELLARFC